MTKTIYLKYNNMTHNNNNNKYNNTLNQISR